MALSRREFLRIYRTMLLSRRFDERCAAIIANGRSLPHYHSGEGQEALMVASVATLRADDWMIYTHRGYGHLLAKGVPLREIALDLLMKKGGTNEGFGGVMHVSRPDLGVPGREGVFGTRFGISAGLGLAARLKGKDVVTLCFYGEAAGSRGALYEALNMAVLWDLPVVFFAENNGWSFTSRTEWLYPQGRMTRVWRGFEIPVVTVDGNDVEAVWSATHAAVERARSGAGPSVLEGLTYRLAPHIWFDDAAYQPPTEVAAWRERDPIAHAESRLRALGVSTQVIEDADGTACSQVDAVFRLVEEAPEARWPERMAALP